MATITSAQTGNFSSTSTWVGGVVPTSADDAVAANGHTVTIDTDVTVLSFQQAGTGKFVLGGGRTVTGNVIANAGTFTSGGTVEVTATTGQTATINGNVTGVSSTAVNIAGIVMSGVGTLIVNGNVTGSLGNASTTANGHAGIYTNVTCALTVNGTVRGGEGACKRGIQVGASSNASLTIVGDVIGGGYPATAIAPYDSHAIQHSGSGSCSISVQGNVFGGGGINTFVCGIFSNNAAISVTGSVNGGSNTNSQNPNGIHTTGNSGTVTVTGAVNGSANIGVGYGIRTDASGAHVNVIGNVSGINYGAIFTSGVSSNITVTGNVVAGTFGNSYGVWGGGANSTVSVIGNITAVGTNNHGVRCDATVNGVVHQGSCTDSLQGATAVYTRLYRLTATNTGTTTYTNTIGYPNGTPVTRISPNLVAGMPATNNVRSGTVYGFNSELTGAMAVPESQSVSFGVPVGNTTGTASLRPEDIAALVGAQVAAAVRDLN